MSNLGTAITAGGTLLGSIAGGLFGNHQMAKAEEYNDKIRAEDRQWALEDYERVLRDSSPASQMERLAMAGLNPNLALGHDMSTTVSMPRGPEAVQNPYNRDSPWRSLDALAMADLFSRIELNKSQANKNNAEADKSKSETKGQDLSNKFNEATLQLRIDWESEKRYETLTNIRHIENMTINEGLMAQANLNLNDEQRKTMAQARLYQVKDYDLRKWEIGENIKLQLESIAVGRIKATAEMQNAAANMMRAITDEKLAAPQIADAWLDYNYNVAYKENYPASEKATQDYIEKRYNLKEKESRDRPRWYRIMQEGMRDVGYFISPVKIAP